MCIEKKIKTLCNFIGQSITKELNPCKRKLRRLVDNLTLIANPITEVAQHENRTTGLIKLIEAIF